MSKIYFSSAKTLLFIVVFLLGLSAYAQDESQTENLVLSGPNITPQEPAIGTSLKMCFEFSATNGATMNLASGENIRVITGFNRIDWASLPNAIITYDYGVFGSQNFMRAAYNEGGKTWRFFVEQNLEKLSSVTVCMNGILAGEATAAQSGNFDGIGFVAELVPHSGDPSGQEEDDIVEFYTFNGTQLVSDLAIIKTVNNATPAVGDNVTFTITATNNGPSDATGVVVNEVLPSGYTLVSATPTTGTWVAPNWTIGDLSDGVSTTMTVVATVNATGTYANTVTIDGDQTDSNPENNTDTETVTPRKCPTGVKCLTSRATKL